MEPLKAIDEIAEKAQEIRRNDVRYRWLRKHLTDAHAIFRKADGFLHSFEFDCEGDIELDAAIDAAMCEQGANT